MLTERIEGKWIDCFSRTFELCGVTKGETVAVLSETLSRGVNVHLSELALLRLGARPFHVVVPTPTQQTDVPIRSTGCSVALAGNEGVIAALCASSFVVDCTVEGVMHSAELPKVLQAGARVLYVSNEHPEILERCAPSLSVRSRFERALQKLNAAKVMQVTSAAGTDLTIRVEGAPAGGGWGAISAAGGMDHWPGGLVACFPTANAINGLLVMDRGDINLTFKRHLETPVRLVIENDYVVRVEGDGLDAELMRSYFAGWKDKYAYAAAHVGFGLNTGARWDSMTMYDRGDHNGVEQRVFGGNFLYSTGANEFAKRYTLGHFDLPIRNCSVALDGETVVRSGVLQGDLA